MWRDSCGFCFALHDAGLEVWLFELLLLFCDLFRMRFAFFVLVCFMMSKLLGFGGDLEFLEWVWIGNYRHNLKISELFPLNLRKPDFGYIQVKFGKSIPKIEILWFRVEILSSSMTIFKIFTLFSHYMNYHVTPCIQDCILFQSTAILIPFPT